jgi:hypothetical protein
LACIGGVAAIVYIECILGAGSHGRILSSETVVALCTADGIPIASGTVVSSGCNARLLRKVGVKKQTRKDENQVSIKHMLALNA